MACGLAANNSKLKLQARSREKYELPYFSRNARLMWGPAVNRQPGYRRRGLVELETIPNDFHVIDLHLMSHSKKVQKRFDFLEVVFEQGAATYSIDFN